MSKQSEQFNKMISDQKAYSKNYIADIAHRCGISYENLIAAAIKYLTSGRCIVDADCSDNDVTHEEWEEFWKCIEYAEDIHNEGTAEGYYYPGPIFVVENYRPWEPDTLAP